MPSRDIVVKELRSLGSLSYSSCKKEGEYKNALEMVAQGLVKITPLSTHRLSLDKTEKAFAVPSQKEKHKSIKAVLPLPED